MRDLCLRTLAAILFVFAACRGESKPPAADAEAVVRPDGWGALRFGMDVAAAAAATGERIEAPAEGCVQLTIAPKGALWMIHDGVLARLDVRAPGLRTEGGAAVGTTAGELRRLYPDAIAEPHKYDPQGSTWVAGPADGAHYVFELDATDRVVRWRAGIPPQVDWVESCG